MESSFIYVTVICKAYNHEKYIRKCLDGFVSQQTEFPFEVIVHDDASTDCTPTIIQEYAEKYPSLFIPIFQKENTYSKHIPVNKVYISPKARGKYVALCEGDDYWKDAHKITKMVMMMEEHPDCVMALHSVQCIQEDGSFVDKFYPQQSFSDGVIDSRVIVQNSCLPYSFQTSCYFMKGDLYWKYIFNPPEFKKKFPVGDVPLILYFASIGNFYFFSANMSCYRLFSSGSWTTRIKCATDEQRCERWLKMAYGLEEFNQYTKKIFADILSPKICQYHFLSDLQMKNYIACLSSQYKEILKRKSFRCIISLYFRAILQFVKKYIKTDE